jgi:glucokinase
VVEKEKTLIMQRTLTIGIDLGATTVKAGLVDADGNILAHQKVDSFAAQGPLLVIGQITYTIRELLAQAKQGEVDGIGVGAPGVVGLDGGVVKYPPNFSNWTEVDLGAELQKEFHLPVEVENDANVAALAEAKFGAGRGRPDFLFVIWGTGVGGGIILNGDIYRGPHGGAGEIGHVTIDYNGALCGCGNHGCVEAYVGQRYLSRRTRDRLHELKRTQPQATSKILDLVQGNFDAIEPYIVSMAAKQGDALARDILEEAGGILGIGLASVLNVLDVRFVIIGGGISAAEKFVFDAIERSITSRVLKGSRGDIRLVPAQLGNKAGILGAASLIQARKKD